VSGHESKTDRVPAAHLIPRAEIEMHPPAPPRLAIPILLLIGVSVAIAATVLLANDRRNMRLLADALHIQLKSPTPQLPPALAANEKPQPPATHAPALTGPPLAPLQAVEPAFQPRDFCQSLGQASQEAPEFTEQQGGSWDCSLLREYSSDQGLSSAFLQIRGGAKGAFSSFRIKFNLLPGGLTAAMLDEALQLMRKSIRPLWNDDEMNGWLGQKIKDSKDFSALTGYYPAVLKHELSDAYRLNFIVMNRPVPQVEPLRIPASWIEMVPRGQRVKPQRGARISASSPS